MTWAASSCPSTKRSRSSRTRASSGPGPDPKMYKVELSNSPASPAKKACFRRLRSACRLRVLRRLLSSLVPIFGSS